MFALVDCNNFYASCERVFKPKIDKKPIIVLSNNDGCVIARSNESKALGIKMGEPAFKLKNIIKKYNINVFSSNLSLYADFSKRVMNVLRSEVKQMEVYSVDEAFLDFSDYSNKERGIALREKVKQWTGIPVSVGIAPTKALSKVANHIAKKYTMSGVFIFDDENLITRALNVFPVEDLWGVGRKNSKRLKEAGIHTALQFRQCDSIWLRRNISVNGVRLQKELFGEVCYPLEVKRNRKKNICTARSFGLEIKEISKLKEVISSYANTCAKKLREEKSCCASIIVFINTNPFKLVTKQYNAYRKIQLDTPTNDSMEIVKAAIRGVEIIFRSDYIYKKAGVIVGEIVPEDQVQLSLFDKLDRNKRTSINKVVDNLNAVMGRDRIKFAVQGSSRKWKINQERLYPCYTTRLSHILEVRV